MRLARLDSFLKGLCLLMSPMRRAAWLLACGLVWPINPTFGQDKARLNELGQFIEDTVQNSTVVSVRRRVPFVFAMRETYERFAVSGCEVDVLVGSISAASTASERTRAWTSYAFDIKNIDPASLKVEMDSDLVWLDLAFTTPTTRTSLREDRTKSAEDRIDKTVVFQRRRCR